MPQHVPILTAQAMLEKLKLPHIYKLFSLAESTTMTGPFSSSSQVCTTATDVFFDRGFRLASRPFPMPTSAVRPIRVKSIAYPSFPHKPPILPTAFEDSYALPAPVHCILSTENTRKSWLPSLTNQEPEYGKDIVHAVRGKSNCPQILAHACCSARALEVGTVEIE